MKLDNKTLLLVLYTFILDVAVEIFFCLGKLENLIYFAVGQSFACTLYAFLLQFELKLSTGI
jgi:hypothetical protein